MKLVRRRSPAQPEAEAPVDGATAIDVPGKKGRPTPKRREVAPKRGPVSAPRTRKEAVQRQRQLSKEARTSAKKPLSGPEYRAALRRGDPSALPARDRGPTRKLARDYVDSRRLLSNYLLLVFPVMFASVIIPTLNLIAIVLLLVFAIEWYLVGRRIKTMALARGFTDRGGSWALGFYAGSRAYLPRRFRMPAPQVERGDSI